MKKERSELLKEKPELSVRLHDVEATGEAIVAVIDTGEGFRTLIGGAFNVVNILGMLEALDDAKNRLNQLLKEQIEQISR